ncbi:transposase, IS605 family, partial [Escherichia coli FRIK2001]
RFRMRIMRPVINTSLTGKWLPGWLSGKMPLKRNGLKMPRHSHCNSH